MQVVSLLNKILTVSELFILPKDFINAFFFN